MKVTYNPEEDTLRILFRNAPIHESEQHRSGLILDYDQHGCILGLELAEASEYLSGSQSASLIEYALVEDRNEIEASKIERVS